MGHTGILPDVTLVTGDSKEVLSAYYAGRIGQMMISLNHYTILDNPVQIRSICREIIAVKQKMAQLRIERQSSR